MRFLFVTTSPEQTMLKINFNTFFIAIVVIISTYVPSECFAKTLFEGYYKIMAGNTHIGYAIQKYEFLPKKKQFASTYYVHTKQGQHETVESLKSVSNQKFNPISYQYTSQIVGNIKTIDATFSGNQARYIISNGKKSNTVQKKIPKGSFLANMLPYVILNNGLSKGKKYSYSAIAEEKAQPMNGSIYFESKKTYKGHQALKAYNTFGNIKYTSLITLSGQAIGTQSTLQGISTQIVNDPSTATKDQPFNTKRLKLIFGRIPSGKKNFLHKD